MTSGLYLVESVNLEDRNYNQIPLSQTILKCLLSKKIIILGFPEKFLFIVFSSQLHINYQNVRKFQPFVIGFRPLTCILESKRMCVCLAFHGHWFLINQYWSLMLKDVSPIEKSICLKWWKGDIGISWILITCLHRSN